MEASELIEEYERHCGERDPWLPQWQELTDFVMPNRGGDFTAQRGPGQKRMQRVFDSTAIWCNEVFAAGMHALLSSPYMRFFVYQTENARVNRMPAARLWLDEVSEAIYGAFANPLTGWMTATDQLYLDEGCLGTAVMLALDSARSTVNFSTRHLARCVIAENDEGEVDLLFLDWEWTAKQAVQYWNGKDRPAAPPKVKEAFAKDPNKKLRFLHAIKPRIDRIAGRSDGRNKAWGSWYVSFEDKAIIDEGGFDEFPAVAPRLSKISGELWGRGRGWTALPDIKQLNVMDTTVVKGAQKVVDPPLQVPHQGFISPIRTLPGGINYYEAGSTDRVEPIRTGGDVRLGLDMLQSKQRRIAQIFYVDLLTMVLNPEDPSGAGKGVTATWVLHWRDQAMQRLSPVLARMQQEFLGRIIPRTARLLMRRGLIRPPPEEMRGQKLRLEYVSPIALMQRATELEAIDRWIAHLAQLGQMDPVAPMLMDVEKAGRLYAERLNVPQGVIRNTVALQEVRRRSVELQRQQMEAGQMAQLAETAKSAGAAAKGFAGAGATYQEAA